MSNQEEDKKVYYGEVLFEQIRLLVLVTDGLKKTNQQKVEQIKQEAATLGIQM